jgi:hypothetical protein
MAKTKRAEGMAQVVEHLPKKHEFKPQYHHEKIFYRIPQVYPLL